jgi:hypothetical protein
MARVVAPVSGGDEAGFVGDDHELRTVACVELGEQSADVGLCRGRAHVQLLADFGVGETAGELDEDLSFTVRERGDATLETNPASVPHCTCIFRSQTTRRLQSSLVGRSGR